MPPIFPFRSIRYQTAGSDLSAFIAPPYDVLDADAKRRLLARDPHNIVAIDLPHLPAKELGPPAAYAAAADAYRAWLDQGVLRRDASPAMFIYRQTFHSAGKTVSRTGMACTVETVPFGPRPGAGGGILPHEETFSGPKADRLALMQATRAQLSPIFGLHPDDDRRASALLGQTSSTRAPDLTADIGDGVRHEVWPITDTPTVSAYQAALAGQDIFIADGHHRYNTTLNYLAALESSGPVPPDHPARRCMMVLVGMNDPGLSIWPTHRVLGGMQAYSLEAFMNAARNHLAIRRGPGGGGSIRELERLLASTNAPNLMGLYDFASARCLLALPLRPDPLVSRFPSKPPEWRALDVALVQHVIVEQICQPALNAGEDIKWAFPHTIEETEAIGRGSATGSGGGHGFTPQLAVILRPTPLESVRAISRAGVLMPQKSTFFYPKLATGLFIHPLDKEPGA